ncbi:IgGFc-binding protein-like [Leptodactylus fuscus]
MRPYNDPVAEYRGFSSKMKPYIDPVAERGGFRRLMRPYKDPVAEGVTTIHRRRADMGFLRILQFCVFGALSFGGYSTELVLVKQQVGSIRLYAKPKVLENLGQVLFYENRFCSSIFPIGGILHGIGEAAGGLNTPPKWKGRTPQGKYFAVGFMQNTISNEKPSREILVTGTSPSTSVTISMNKSNFKKEITVGKGETVIIELPKYDEIKGTGTSPYSTIIEATAPITVMSRNFKRTSGDVALMYPADQWGYDHYIVTPFTGPSDHYAEFSVLAQDIPTTVNIILSADVQFNGKNYKKGDTMTVNLEPHQFLQVQSEGDLSNTRVMSENPTAVQTGHSCAPSNGGCSHVYLQLQSAENFGTSFFVPGLSLQSTYDLVFVFSPQTTVFELQSCGEQLKIKAEAGNLMNSVPQGRQLSPSSQIKDSSKRKKDLSVDSCIQVLTSQSGGQNPKIKLEAGKLMKLNVSMSSSVSIHSAREIQVLRFVAGGEYEGNQIGSFLTQIPDVDSFQRKYNLIGQKGFQKNLAIVIAKTSHGSEITHNGEVLDDITWEEIPQSGYSFAIYDYGGGFSSNIVEHPTSSFGLLAIGFSKDKAYGTVAPGIQGEGNGGEKSTKYTQQMKKPSGRCSLSMALGAVPLFVLRLARRKSVSGRCPVEENDAVPK